MKVLIAVISCQLIIIGWFALTIIRLENVRYAASIGVCDKSSVSERFQCLSEYESGAKSTRTSNLWHLLYGLKVL